jgi:hypothetical protein
MSTTPGNHRQRSDDFTGIDGVHRDAQPSEAIGHQQHHEASRADALYWRQPA